VESLIKEFLGDDLGPYANLIEVGTFVFAAITGTYLYCRRKLIRKDAEAEITKDDLTQKTRQLKEERTMVKVLAEKLSAVKALLPDTARETAEEQSRDGDLRGALQTLHTWADQNARAISDLLGTLTVLTFAQAAGENRKARLSAALHYIELANRFSAANAHNQYLEEEVRAFLKREGHVVDPHAASLDEIDSYLDENSFQSDAVEHALERGRLADQLVERELRHLAIGVLNGVVPVLKKHLGISSTQFLDAEKKRIQALSWIGHARLAFNAIEALLSELSSVLPKSDRRVLEFRAERFAHMVEMGNVKAEISSAQELAEQLAEHPDFGPLHHVTLEFEEDLARALDYLGETVQGISLIEQVIKKAEESPDFGEQHERTLIALNTLGWMLSRVLRLPDALAVLTRAANGLMQHPNYGPQQAKVLEIHRRIADVLDSLDRADEAIPIIESVVRGYTDNPQVGPNHIATLASRFLHARILLKKGKPHDALPIFEEVSAAQIESPSIGRLHKDSLVTRTHLALTMLHIGMLEQAAKVIGQVLRDWREGDAVSESDRNFTLAQQVFKSVTQALVLSDKLNVSMP
jgi:tetratricopeptide (TPR) repeat protein